MIYIRLALLILVLMNLMNLSVYAQIQSRELKEKEKSQAFKFDEYEKIANPELTLRFEKFVRYVKNNNTDSGVIIIYASNDKGRKLREATLTSNWGRNPCHWDCRFTFVRAPYSSKERTELWVIPKGAELPELKLEAYKFDQYSKIKTKNLEIRLRNFWSEMAKSVGSTGEIVIYALNEEKINKRVKAVNRFFRLHSSGAFFDRFDVARITFIRVREPNEKTEFWMIPSGAKSPLFENALE